MPGRRFSAAWNYRFGFNGFEKDDEIKGNGNHISFGDHGYDPRTGRRWTPDVFEKKYPSLSPYSVFNNNPIIYKDVNGQDWEITTTFDKQGNKTIHIKLTAAVLDATTAQKIDVNAFKAAVSTQVKNTYSISFKEASKYETVNLNKGLDMPANNIIVPIEFRDVNVVVDVDVRVINKQSDLKSTEHLIKIVDDNSSELPSDATAAVNEIGGTELRIKEKYVGGIISNTNKKTLVHELGHTLGLRHLDVKAETPGELISSFFGGTGNPQYKGPVSSNPKNVMLSKYKPGANQVNPSQINTAVNEYNSGNLNKK
jgi:hypothetical protein